METVVFPSPEDELALGLALPLPQKVLGDLGLIAAVGFGSRGGDAGFGGDFRYWAKRGGLGDFDIGHHGEYLLWGWGCGGKAAEKRAGKPAALVHSCLLYQP